MAGNTDSNRKSNRNLILFKPGQSGNPNGRPKGQRNYRTIYREALERIGAAEGYSADEIEDAMTFKAIQKAIKGDFFFYKDINDRIHGKPKETIDLGSGGKSLAELIATANGTPGRRKGPPASPRTNTK